MIRVQILCAQNLPVPTKKERKTRIFCFSRSSCPYFYASYKNDECSRCPKWNISLDIDLFRCNTLTFKLFSVQLVELDIFLGEVVLDIPTFLSQSPGKEITNSPYKPIQFEFPLTSCNYPGSTLQLSFLYSPKIYRPIQPKEISNPQIHLWATFSPSTEANKNTIKIELIQAYIVKDKKIKNGFYSHYGTSHPWESVGYSSLTNEIYGPTGFTPICTFFPDRITGKFHFFIVDVSDYSGIVTLNFVAEQAGNEFKFNDGVFVVPKKFHPQIGTMKTVDIEVEPNTKYLVPLYLYFEKKIIGSKTEFNSFPFLSRNKSLMADTKSFSDHISSENTFHSSIIELATSAIDEFKDVSFRKIYLLPNSEHVSLERTFRDFNLPVSSNSNLRIYVNGSTSFSDGRNCYVDLWNPFFLFFDSKTKKKCKDIKYCVNSKKLFQKDVFGNEWHSFVDLDLDQIGTDKTIVFNIQCNSTLESAIPPGLIFITKVDGENETLLFKNPIFSDSNNSHYATFFRFEFIENTWNIIPMRNYFEKEDEFHFFINEASNNNWEITKTVLDKMNENCMSESSNDEMLLESINAF